MNDKNKKKGKSAAKSHLQTIRGTVKQLSDLTQRAENGSITPEQAQTIRENAQIILNCITEFTKSETYTALKEGMAAFYSYMDEHRADFAYLKQVGAELIELAPYLQLELEAVQDDPEYQGCTLDELLADGFDDKGQPIKSKFEQIIERAQARQAEFNAATGMLKEIEHAAAELPRVSYKKTTDIKTITDKLTNVFFSLTAEQPKEMINGQRAWLELQYEGKDKKKEITLMYDYTWDEQTLKKLGLDKKFTDFDFFVMSIMDSFHAVGNDVVSLTKFFTEMGGEGSPNGKQLKPIYESLVKGLSTTMTIDDYEVRAAWNIEDDDDKEKKTYHEIISPVMPVIIGNERFIANGQISKGYVKINDFSPFWRLASPIGHVTAWDKKILRLYTGKKTKRYYSVLRFLMQQIGWMRNGNRNNKILYSTLYKYTGDNASRGQELARDMMYRILDEVFIPAEYVSAYKEEADPTPGVKLTICKKRLQIEKKK